MVSEVAEILSQRLSRDELDLAAKLNIAELQEAVDTAIGRDRV